MAQFYQMLKNEKIKEKEIKEDSSHYKWKKGDHICEVAQKFEITCKKLIELNHLTNIEDIREGDIIRIK